MSARPQDTQAAAAPQAATRPRRRPGLLRCSNDITLLRHRSTTRRCYAIQHAITLQQLLPCDAARANHYILHWHHRPPPCAASSSGASSSRCSSAALRCSRRSLRSLDLYCCDAAMTSHCYDTAAPLAAATRSSMQSHCYDTSGNDQHCSNCCPAMQLGQTTTYCTGITGHLHVRPPPLAPPPPAAPRQPSAAAAAASAASSSGSSSSSALPPR